MTTELEQPDPRVRRLKGVVIRFAGDSGDGMQLTGDRFGAQAAEAGNDVATLPDFPAEIRAPAGTVGGVSSYQLHVADHDITTPGDQPDVLVAMNPAALKATLKDLRPGGVLVVDSGAFNVRALEKAGYDSDPLTDGSLSNYIVHAVDLTGLAVGATEGLGLKRKDAARTKNMFALGLVSWMFNQPVESTVAYLEKRFAKKPPEILAGNLASLRAGVDYGDTTEAFAVSYEVKPAPLPPGTYRHMRGNRAIAFGLVAAAHQAGMPLFLGAYPITPATDVLHELSKLISHDVRSYQAEDEIAAIGASIGGAFAGMLAVTVTSGPGMALKSEAIGLAISLELPLVIVNVQRGGPSTGLPTKTEQSDLLQALYGRHGEAPLPVIAAQSPADCFNAAFEAAQIALERRTPVILLSDSYIANGSEPWKVPDVSELPDLGIEFATEPNGIGKDGKPAFHPYKRDPRTLARPLAIPGTPGLEHRIGGLEKADGSGEISHDADNHDLMVRTRQNKVDGIEVPPLEVDDPSGPPGFGSKLLVIGWGSTYGPIGAACRLVRQQGLAIAQAHLRYLNPLPANLASILAAYDTVLVPEMNLGQLGGLLRMHCQIEPVGYTQTRGLPFRAVELAAVFTRLVNDLEDGAAALSTEDIKAIGGTGKVGRSELGSEKNK
ncbi:2-oxoglutarate ferredoxin oxidoreductase subunit alpha [Parafrankia irregularis]|uniref:2-oxoglutarate ferredoxin oxidoreductase subunit alpha n=1 Tax=Parafrankia irregularis TaxID=795642 RepID=A0A0S4QJK8_9ACTN|nr:MULTISPECIES: 2-oxoacid:acceptor oxidoreductase subunit alpha [Parafrankia]MBE3203879.1 2-oxoacid:acceptor oxidoreductase subunit alpha [Parafrankia sp. CH37]CUU55250.1 2-oxoglutarate ferredoxin oxidoreductase subunit alpha [Parafrankia irregularis]